MKATSGNLRLDQTYSIESTDYLGGFETFDFTTCQNCGLAIANVANVKGSVDGRIYAIGLDCAATLTSINACELAEAKKKLARKARFIKFMKTEAKSVVYAGGNNDTAWVYKSIQKSWKSFWTYRISYSANKALFERLGIPVNIEAIN